MRTDADRIGSDHGRTTDSQIAPFPIDIPQSELDIAIRSYVEKENTVTRWTDMDRGGHFAALEEPDLLVADIREFFANLR